MPIRKSNDTLFYLIGTIPVVWLALLLAQSLGGGLPELLRNLTSALEQPTNIVWTDKSLPTILICLAAYGMAVLLYRTNQGRTRDGEEHGSAAWATPASVNAQFAQKDSIPLTQHVRLGLDTHKHRRSLNVLVIGGSGAAKTRSFVLPNILTANTNYVITDPKSEVLLATGGYLKEQGYDVRVLNLVNLEQSDGYNPFRYLRDEKDVLKLVNNLIQSTTPKGSHESDPFWTKAETALLQAIILMLFQEAPEYEQNFSMVMRVYLRSVFQQMTVLVYVVDKCLSVLILDGALNVLFDLIIHFAVKTDFPILLRCRSRNGVDLAKNTSCFQAIYILLGIRIARHDLFCIFAVNPTLNGINAILTSAKFNGLAHRHSKRSDLFHHVKLRLFCIVLRNIGNTQKIPCAVFVGNTVFFITRPAFVYWFFRYKIHIFSP